MHVKHVGGKLFVESRTRFLTTTTDERNHTPSQKTTNASSWSTSRHCGTEPSRTRSQACQAEELMAQLLKQRKCTTARHDRTNDRVTRRPGACAQVARWARLPSWRPRTHANCVLRVRSRVTFTRRRSTNACNPVEKLNKKQREDKHTCLPPTLSTRQRQKSTSETQPLSLGTHSSHRERLEKKGWFAKEPQNFPRSDGLGPHVCLATAPGTLVPLKSPLVGWRPHPFNVCLTDSGIELGVARDFSP